MVTANRKDSIVPQAFPGCIDREFSVVEAIEAASVSSDPEVSLSIYKQR
jgi:hypothetical protein